ncbi:HTH-type transcriptional regulator UlaR, partial [Escherichia coli]
YESCEPKKVRNGAEATTQQRPRWTPMNLHQAQNHDEKVRITKAASQLVNPGESVVINCGSTAFLRGREMGGKPVQIITNH